MKNLVAVYEVLYTFVSGLLMVMASGNETIAYNQPVAYIIVLFIVAIVLSLGLLRLKARIFPKNG